MTQFVNALVIPAPVGVVFSFFRTPANLQLLAPPELQLELIAAPPRLELGSRLELKGRRWGVPQRTALEVTALEMGKLLIEEQRAGPFRHWKQVHRFEPLGDNATRLSDEVTFEPPGGMLGLLVTATFVERELTAFYEHRNRRLLELLGDPEKTTLRPA